MGAHKDHGWRGDSYTLIRGDIHADVSRGWCVESECTTAWRWTVYRIDSHGSVDQMKVPATERRDGFPTKGEAMLACERFFSSLADEERYRRAARFEGMEPDAEVAP